MTVAISIAKPHAMGKNHWCPQPGWVVALPLVAAISRNMSHAVFWCLGQILEACGHLKPGPHCKGDTEAKFKN